jgi:hypothetical protein
MRTADYRLALQHNGYSPIPIRSGTKRPPMTAWPQLANATADDIQNWERIYSNAPGTGIIPGRVGMLDIDVTDPVAAEEMREAARGWLSDLGKVLIRIGEPPKCGIFFRTESPFVKKSHSYKGGHKLELLGQGQQAVIDGIHPDTGKPYQFENSITPEEIAADELPLLTESSAIELLSFLDEILRKHFGFVHVSAGNGHTHQPANPELPDRMAHCQPGSKRLDMESWFATFDGSGASANHLQPPALRALALDGVEHNEAAKIVVDAIMAEAPSDWTEVREFSAVVSRQRSVLTELLREHDWSKGAIPDWMPEADQARCAQILEQGEIPAYGRNRFGCFLYSATRSGVHTGGKKDEEAPTDQPSKPRAAPRPKDVPKRKEIQAIPFEPFDEATFPRRQFLYAMHYQRGQCTCSVGQDGAGKSTVSIGEAISMACARNVLNEEPAERCRVWLHNADDDAEEVYRRIGAFCRHNGIPQEDLRGWLFATGKDSFDIRVATGNGHLVPEQSTVAAITETIIENEIDVLVLDPLVAMHAVAENNNMQMSEVIHIFSRIAANCNCAIDVAHHVRKPSNGTDEKEFSSDDARGASAVRAAVRASRVFNRMSRAEAVAAGVSPEERARYIRIDRGKANYLPPAIKGTWFHLANVQLANGDQVGVIEPWTFPGQEGVAADLEMAQKTQEHVFLEILRRFNEAGRPASERSNSAHYAPKVFALEEEAKLAKLAPAYLEAAMLRLLKRKLIKPVDTRSGPDRARIHTLIEVVEP